MQDTLGFLLCGQSWCPTISRSFKQWKREGKSSRIDWQAKANKRSTPHPQKSTLLTHTHTHTHMHAHTRTHAHTHNAHTHTHTRTCTHTYTRTCTHTHTHTTHVQAHLSLLQSVWLWLTVCVRRDYSYHWWSSAFPMPCKDVNHQNESPGWSGSQQSLKSTNNRIIFQPTVQLQDKISL